jgi:hypothetical protein
MFLRHFRFFSALLTIFELQRTSSKALPFTTPPTRNLPGHHRSQHLDYGKIKRYCECKLGIPSQCVQYAHVQKAQPQYISNVLMKFNARSRLDFSIDNMLQTYKAFKELIDDIKAMVDAHNTEAAVAALALEKTWLP